MKRAWSIYKSTGVDFSCELFRKPEIGYPTFKKNNYSRFKTLSLLTLTLFCTISAVAQPWFGTVPGNIYYNQGNVGIGTTNPGIKLTTKSNYTPGTYYSAINVLPSDGSAGGLYLGSIQTDNAIVGSGGTYNDAGKWMSKSTSLSAISLNNGSISFIANAGLSPNTEFVPTTSMTIASSGNIGIGTTNPWAKLHVSGSDDSSGIGVLNLTTPGGTVLKLGGNINYSWIQSHASKPLYINELGNNVIFNSGGGNVGIGTTNPEAKLTVKGKIVASEIQVKDVGTIPDYVFKPEYELMPLSHVEEFVKQNLHLPEVPSEKEFKENGMNMAEMNALLLKKIEELTLYAIDQNKKISALSCGNKELKQENLEIKQLLETIVNANK